MPNLNDKARQIEVWAISFCDKKPDLNRVHGTFRLSIPFDVLSLKK